MSNQPNPTGFESPLLTTVSRIDVAAAAAAASNDAPQLAAMSTPLISDDEGDDGEHLLLARLGSFRDLVLGERTHVGLSPSTDTVVTEPKKDAPKLRTTPSLQLKKPKVAGNITETRTSSMKSRSPNRVPLTVKTPSPTRSSTTKNTPPSRTNSVNSSVKSTGPPPLKAALKTKSAIPSPSSPISKPPTIGDALDDFLGVAVVADDYDSDASSISDEKPQSKSRRSVSFVDQPIVFTDSSPVELSESQFSSPIAHPEERVQEEYASPNYLPTNLSSAIPTTDMLEEMGESIRVVARVRPPLTTLHSLDAVCGHAEEEWVRGNLLGPSSTVCISTDDTETIVISGRNARKKSNFESAYGGFSNRGRTDKLYRFSRVYDETATQEDLCEEAFSFVDFAVSGHNALVMAYGPMLSGKTFTMMGNDHVPVGVVPSALERVFQCITFEREKYPSAHFEVEMSFVEFYKNQFRNLLLNVACNAPSYMDSMADMERAVAGGSGLLPVMAGNMLPAVGDASEYETALSVMQQIRSRTGKVDVRENPALGISLYGPNIRIPVKSADDALRFLREGEKYRTLTADTDRYDITSTRGHLVVTLYIDSKLPLSVANTVLGNLHEDCPTASSYASSSTEVLRLGKLHLVDLASGERASESKIVGESLMEAQAINRSLLALGDVIVALHDCSAAHRKRRLAAAKGRVPKNRGLTSSSIESRHIPYLNSRFTHYIKDTFGANGQTLFLLCLPPESSLYFQSIQALDYAKKAQAIYRGTGVSVNTVILNSHFHVDPVSELTVINQMKRMILEEEASRRSGLRNRTDSRLSMSDGIGSPSEGHLQSSPGVGDNSSSWILNLNNIELLDLPYEFFPMRPWISIRLGPPQSVIKEASEQGLEVPITQNWKLEPELYSGGVVRYDDNLFGEVEDSYYAQGVTEFEVRVYTSKPTEIGAIELGRTRYPLLDVFPTVDKPVLATIPLFHLGSDNTMRQKGYVSIVGQLLHPQLASAAAKVAAKETIAAAKAGPLTLSSNNEQLPSALTVHFRNFTTHEAVVARGDKLLNEQQYVFSIELAWREDNKTIVTSAMPFMTSTDGIVPSSVFSPSGDICGGKFVVSGGQSIYATDYFSGVTRIRGKDLLANIQIEDHAPLRRVTQDALSNLSLQVSLFVSSANVARSGSGVKVLSTPSLIGRSTVQLNVLSDCFFDGGIVDIPLSFREASHTGSTFRGSLSISLGLPESAAAKRQAAIERGVLERLLRLLALGESIAASVSGDALDAINAPFSGRLSEAGWLKFERVEVDRVNTLRLLGNHIRYESAEQDVYEAAVSQDLILVMGFGDRWRSASTVLHARSDCCAWHNVDFMTYVRRGELLSTPLTLALLKRSSTSQTNDDDTRIDEPVTLVGMAAVPFGWLCHPSSLPSLRSTGIKLRGLDGRANGRVFLHGMYVVDNADTWQSATIIDPLTAVAESSETTISADGEDELTVSVEYLTEMAKMGRYSVRYTDGVVEHGVSKDLIHLPTRPAARTQLLRIQTISNSARESDLDAGAITLPSGQSTPANRPPLYSVGQQVEANWKRKGKWYTATIWRVHHQEDGCTVYDLDYLSGERESAITEDRIKPLNNLRRKSSFRNTDLTPTDSLTASPTTPRSTSNGRGSSPRPFLQNGVSPRSKSIVRTNSFTFSPNQAQENSPAPHSPRASGNIMPLESSVCQLFTEDELSSFAPGDRIEFCVTGDGRFSLGTVEGVSLDALTGMVRYSVLSDQNNQKFTQCSATQVRAPSRDVGFSVGTEVEGNFRGTGEWLLATVRRNRNDGVLYDLTYHAGYVETKVEAHNVRRVAYLRASKNSQNGTGGFHQRSQFRVGEIVEVSLYGYQIWLVARVVSAVLVKGRFVYSVRFDVDPHNIYDGSPNAITVEAVEEIWLRHITSEAVPKDILHSIDLLPAFDMGTTVSVKCRSKGVAEECGVFRDALALLDSGLSALYVKIHENESISALAAHSASLAYSRRKQVNIARKDFSLISSDLSDATLASEPFLHLLAALAQDQTALDSAIVELLNATTLGRCKVAVTEDAVVRVVAAKTTAASMLAGVRLTRRSGLEETQVASLALGMEVMSDAFRDLATAKTTTAVISDALQRSRRLARKVCVIADRIDVTISRLLDAALKNPSGEIVPQKGTDGGEMRLDEIYATHSADYGDFESTAKCPSPQVKASEGILGGFIARFESGDKAQKRLTRPLSLMSMESVATEVSNEEDGEVALTDDELANAIFSAIRHAFFISGGVDQALLTEIMTTKSNEALTKRVIDHDGGLDAISKDNQLWVELVDLLPKHITKKLTPTMLEAVKLTFVECCDTHIALTRFIKLRRQCRDDDAAIATKRLVIQSSLENVTAAKAALLAEREALDLFSTRLTVTTQSRNAPNMRYGVAPSTPTIGRIRSSSDFGGNQSGSRSRANSMHALDVSHPPGDETAASTPRSDRRRMSRRFTSGSFDFLSSSTSIQPLESRYYEATTLRERTERLLEHHKKTAQEVNDEIRSLDARWLRHAQLSLSSPSIAFPENISSVSASGNATIITLESDDSSWLEAVLSSSRSGTFDSSIFQAATLYLHRSASHRQRLLKRLEKIQDISMDASRHVVAEQSALSAMSSATVGEVEGFKKLKSDVDALLTYRRLRGDLVKARLAVVEVKSGVSKCRDEIAACLKELTPSAETDSSSPETISPLSTPKGANLMTTKASESITLLMKEAAELAKQQSAAEQAIKMSAITRLAHEFEARRVSELKSPPSPMSSPSAALCDTSLMPPSELEPNNGSLASHAMMSALASAEFDYAALADVNVEQQSEIVALEEVALIAQRRRKVLDRALSIARAELRRAKLLALESTFDTAFAQLNAAVSRVRELSVVSNAEAAWVAEHSKFSDAMRSEDIAMNQAVVAVDEIVNALAESRIGPKILRHRRFGNLVSSLEEKLASYKLLANEARHAEDEFVSLMTPVNRWRERCENYIHICETTGSRLRVYFNSLKNATTDTDDTMLEKFSLSDLQAQLSDAIMLANHAEEFAPPSLAAIAAGAYGSPCCDSEEDTTSSGGLLPPATLAAIASTRHQSDSSDGPMDTDSFVSFLENTTSRKRTIITSSTDTADQISNIVLRLRVESTALSHLLSSSTIFATFSDSNEISLDRSTSSGAIDGAEFDLINGNPSLTDTDPIAFLSSPAGLASYSIIGATVSDGTSKMTQLKNAWYESIASDRSLVTQKTRDTIPEDAPPTLPQTDRTKDILSAKLQRVFLPTTAVGSVSETHEFVSPFESLKTSMVHSRRLLPRVVGGNPPLYMPFRGKKVLAHIGSLADAIATGSLTRGTDEPAAEISATGSSVGDSSFVGMSPIKRVTDLSVVLETPAKEKRAQQGQLNQAWRDYEVSAKESLIRSESTEIEISNLLETLGAKLQVTPELFENGIRSDIFRDSPSCDLEDLRQRTVFNDDDLALLTSQFTPTSTVLSNSKVENTTAHTHMSVTQTL